MKTLQDADVGRGDGKTLRATTSKKEIFLAPSATHQLMYITWTVTSVLSVPLSTTDQETTRG